MLSEGIVRNCFFSAHVFFDDVLDVKVGVAGQNVFPSRSIPKNSIASVECVFHSGEFPVSSLP